MSTLCKRFYKLKASYKPTTFTGYSIHINRYKFSKILKRQKSEKRKIYHKIKILIIIIMYQGVNIWEKGKLGRALCNTYMFKKKYLLFIFFYYFCENSEFYAFYALKAIPSSI